MTIRRCNRPDCDRPARVEDDGGRAWCALDEPVSHAVAELRFAVMSLNEQVRAMRDEIHSIKASVDYMRMRS